MISVDLLAIQAVLPNRHVDDVTVISLRLATNYNVIRGVKYVQYIAIHFYGVYMVTGTCTTSLSGNVLFIEGMCYFGH